jgi:HK97 family phage portal protein
MGIIQKIDNFVQSTIDPAPLMGPGGRRQVDSGPAGLDSRWLMDDSRWIANFSNNNGGVAVTKNTALTYAAVWAAIRALSEGLAMLPLQVYQKLPDGTKRLAIDHPLYEILHLQPNPLMSSFQWRETGMLHLCTDGNFYNLIVTGGAGQVLELDPFMPDEIEPKLLGGQLVYEYKNKDQYPASQILHIPGLGWDGLVGLSPITMARRSIGLGLSLDQEGKSLIDNGTVPGSVLETDAKLSDQAYNRLKQETMDEHKGPKKAGKLMILEEGLKYAKVGLNPADAQFIESRKFQISDIARWFKVPPHMLSDLERATFSNIEEMGIEFVNYSLQPWITRWEQQATIKLMTRRDRQQGYFIEFMIDGLLRGNIEGRYNAYVAGRNGGWLSVNDIRKKENMNPVPGGDSYLVPLNYAVVSGSSRDGLLGQPRSLDQGLGQAGGGDLVIRYASPEKRAAAAALGRYQLAGTQQMLFLDKITEILRRERNDISAEVQRLVKAGQVNKLQAWIQAFYTEHKSWAAERMLPLMQVYAKLIAEKVGVELGLGDQLDARIDNFVVAYALEFGARESAESISILERIIEEQALDTGIDINEAMAETFRGWLDQRAVFMATEESIRQSNATAVTLYEHNGVEKIKSVATGSESCPYCTALDQKVIGIKEVFLQAGQSFQPGNTDTPLPVTHSKRHPPYHRGCDCIVVAEVPEGLVL